VNQEWVVYQWLFEVIVYLFYSLAGFQGLGFFTLLVITTTYTLLFINLRIQNVNPVYAAIALGISGWINILFWYARPAISTYLMLSLVLLIFTLAEKNSYRYLWALPIVVMLWANLHLGFLSGIFLISLYAFYRIVVYFYDKSLKNKDIAITMLFTTVGCYLMSLLNPYGIRLYTYMHSLASSEYMNNNIKELLSPDFHKNFYQPLLVMIFLVVFLSFSNRRTNYFYIILLGISLATALLFVRNVPFFAIFAGLVLAFELQNIQEFFAGNEKIHKFIRYPFDKLSQFQAKQNELLAIKPKPLKLPLSLLVILSFLFVLIPNLETGYIVKNIKFSMNYTKDRPYDAYIFVKKFKPPGRLYAPPTWGSYAIFHLYPDYKVYIDTRFDMYGEEFFKSSHHLKLVMPGWEKKLIKYDVNWVVIPVKCSMANLMRGKHEKYWFEVYKDKTAAIFMLRSPENEKWFKESGAQKAYREGLLGRKVEIKPVSKLKWSGSSQKKEK
jgi:MFS family permease